MSIFQSCQKTFPLLINDNEEGPSGGAQRKIDKFLLRGRMTFCYHVNKFLTVSLLSEIFTEQNFNFREKIVPKMQFWAQTNPPCYPV